MLMRQVWMWADRAGYRLTTFHHFYGWSLPCVDVCLEQIMVEVEVALQEGERVLVVKSWKMAWCCVFAEQRLEHRSDTFIIVQIVVLGICDSSKVSWGSFNGSWLYGLIWWCPKVLGRLILEVVIVVYACQCWMHARNTTFEPWRGKPTIE
jgi:hypothetical protein